MWLHWMVSCHGTKAVVQIRSAKLEISQSEHTTLLARFVIKPCSVHSNSVIVSLNLLKYFQKLELTTLHDCICPFWLHEWLFGVVPSRYQKGQEYPICRFRVSIFCCDVCTRVVCVCACVCGVCVCARVSSFVWLVDLSDCLCMWGCVCRCEVCVA